MTPSSYKGGFFILGSLDNSPLIVASIIAKVNNKYKRIIVKLPTYSLASKPKIAIKYIYLLDTIIFKLKKKKAIKALKVTLIISAS